MSTEVPEMEATMDTQVDLLGGFGQVLGISRSPPAEDLRDPLSTYLPNMRTETLEHGQTLCW
ncbi:hypothetical protein GBF38_018894 [Nibea albiflora]|uniref:Uncharacterized protein n=1 Tax=Nibea albiflora TaxID=240163 RepID=A0ACB7EPV4_NIBAL|nr:hypothetical protein GBF38_018894 [Nibea albiflora]